MTTCVCADQGASPELKRMAEEAASSLRDRPQAMPTSFESTAAVEQSAATPRSRSQLLAWLPPQPEARSGSLESSLQALGGFLTGDRPAEAAEAEVSFQDSTSNHSAAH